jgi:hypothetical protein
VDLVRALSGAHDKLWALWELVALGEPLAVLAPTPSQASAAVFAVLGLIHPLPFVGDWRPYFCIQDAEFERLAAARCVRDALPKGAVFGVTSAHVLQCLKFAHVLSVCGEGDAGVKVTYKPGLKTPHNASLYRSKQLAGVMSSAVAARAKRGACPASCLDVRACLLDRVTRPFIRAFDQYLVPTWGGRRDVGDAAYVSDPFGKVVRLAGLDLDVFPTAEDLAAPGVLALFKCGTVSKSRARSFYGRFVHGPVFKAWWKAAQASALRECAAVHREAMLEACARGVGVVLTQLDSSAAETDARQVDDMVDKCLRIRTELTAVPAGDKLLRERLYSLLKDISRGLPEELVASVGGLDPVTRRD